MKDQQSRGITSLGYDPNGHPDRRMALPRVTLPPGEDRDEWLVALCERPWLMGPSSIWRHTSAGVRLKEEEDD